MPLMTLFPTSLLTTVTSMFTMPLRQMGARLCCAQGDPAKKHIERPESIERPVGITT